MVGNTTPGLKMRSRILSLEEANKMLPLLEKIVRDIMKTWEEIIHKRTELECLEKNPDQNAQDVQEEAQELKSDLNRLIDRINSYIREVEQLGCFVEEFKRGIINFPSLYHGRKVFLCWGLEDENVGYWHELDESYNDRIRIQDTSQFLSESPTNSTLHEKN